MKAVVVTVTVKIGTVSSWSRIANSGRISGLGFAAASSAVFNNKKGF